MNNSQELNIHNTNPALQLYKTAFEAANNRTIVFTAIRNEDSIITDFEFSLIGRGTKDFFNGEDVTGKRFMEVNPDNNKQLASMIRVMETGEPYDWETTFIHQDGTTHWVNISDVCANDTLVRVWEDITQRRQDEALLNSIIAKKAEEKYLSLFQSIEQGFCIIEVVFDESDKPYDYIFIDYNPAFEKQTGLKDARGKSIKSMYPNQEQHWFDLYGGIAKNRQPIYFEQRADLIDGWYEVSAFPLTKELDNKVAVIFNDVTQRKKAELELNAFNARLETEVKERTAKLKDLNSLLEEKNEQLEKNNKELESFNYIASHDLQEPLRKIQTFLSMIGQRSDNKAAVESYMHKISSSAERM